MKIYDNSEAEYPPMSAPIGSSWYCVEALHDDFWATNITPTCFKGKNNTPMRLFKVTKVSYSKGHMEEIRPITEELKFALINNGFGVL